MLIKKSLLYASKTFAGAALCWYGLVAFGMKDPIWAVITVIIVSDPDLKTTRMLAKTRAINTAVGCFFGLTSLLIFGYVPWICLLTAAVTVLAITLIEHYPSNWRLAPVTVVIIMDAGRQAAGRQDEMTFAIMRMIEIGVGCAVALLLAGIYTHLFSSKSAAKAVN